MQDFEIIKKLGKINFFNSYSDSIFFLYSIGEGAYSIVYKVKKKSND